jgi:Fur family peroxide stress response transcriptional regulator
MPDKELIKILTANDLRITPQRTVVLEVILSLETHPTAEEIIDYARFRHPHIQIGTVYKILDAFTKKGIIQRVKCDNGVIRFDPVKEPHHHLYCKDSERIEDYLDPDLHKIISLHLKKKKIPNFSITDFKLQIVGTFEKNNEPIK